jgi:hypothetical protein
MSVLAERLRAVHVSLTNAGFPHAFGGAIALAYCTEEPRGTRDLDVNVFVGVNRADEVLDSLPEGVSVTKRDRAAAKRAGQVRVMWGDTPLDLFFDTHDFHREVADEIATVPFEDTEIPVLGCHALAVFKAMFNRTRDWADIEAMLDAGTVDGRRVLATCVTLLGENDPSVVRLHGLLEESG